MTFEMKRNQAGFTCRRRAVTTQHFLLSSTLVLDKTPPNNKKKLQLQQHDFLWRFFATLDLLTCYGLCYSID